MLIGSGLYRYEMNRDWAKVPPTRSFGTTHAIAQDAAGRIFVLHTGPDSVYIFSPEGEFLNAWGGDRFAGAHGMDIREEADGEFVYITASLAGLVIKLTCQGEEVLRIGRPPRSDIYGDGRIYKPTEAAVASNGDIYVADGYGQYWVHRFSSGGVYLDSFNGGAAPFNNPHGVTIETRSASERVLVADRRNGTLRYFDLFGNPLRDVEGIVRYPCTAVQWKELLYVPDLRSRVTILDHNDELVMHLGDWPSRWTEPGWPNLPIEGAHFSSPHDLHVDQGGNIYVAEWRSDGVGVVSKLTRAK